MTSTPADLTKPQPRAYTADGGERLAARLVPLPASYKGPVSQIPPAAPASAWGPALAASAGAAATGAMPRFTTLFQLLRGGDSDPKLPSYITWKFAEAFTGEEIKSKTGWVGISGGSVGEVSKPEFRFMQNYGLLAPAACRSVVSHATLVKRLRQHHRFRGVPAAQLPAKHLQAVPPYTGFGSAAAAAPAAAAAAEPDAAEQAAALGAASAAEPIAVEQAAGGEAAGAAGGLPSAGNQFVMLHLARH